MNITIQIARPRPTGDVDADRAAAARHAAQDVATRKMFRAARRLERMTKRGAASATQMNRAKRLYHGRRAALRAFVVAGGAA